MEQTKQQTEQQQIGPDVIVKALYKQIGIVDDLFAQAEKIINTQNEQIKKLQAEIDGCKVID